VQHLLEHIRRLEIKARRLVDASFAGSFRSAFRGSGLEFEEVRAYQYGDDIRTIDWNVTAKSNGVFVKVFREERQQNVFVLLDRSASQRFGDVNRQKLSVAMEIAYIIGFCALRNNDKFGMATFTDRVEHYYPPTQGRKHLLSIFTQLTQQLSSAKTTRLRAALEFFRRVQRRKSILFVLSDFLDEGYERALAGLTRKHEIVLIRLFHPHETAFAQQGLLPVVDMETNIEQWIFVSPFRKKIIQQQGLALVRTHARLEALSASHRMDYLSVDISKEYISLLEQLFRSRIAQKGRK